MEKRDIILKLESISDLIRFFDFEPEMVNSKITKNEMKTLMQIKFRSGQSLSYYSNKIGLKKGSFTALTDSLEEKGLIIKSFLENDKRVKVIFPSTKGKKQTEVFYNSLQDYLGMKLSNLTDKDLVLFESAVNLLTKISF